MYRTKIQSYNRKILQNYTVISFQNLEQALFFSELKKKNEFHISQPIIIQNRNN